MKISERMRFAHPLLWEGTGDYKTGAFEVTNVRVAERLDTGEVNIDCAFAVSQPEIGALLARGVAQAGLFVTCLETYHNGLQPLPAAGGVVTIPGGRLKGRVILRPLIWANERIESFRAEALHAEFGTAELDLARGSILALSDEVVINVGREKLAPIESIFELCRDDAVPAEQIAVQLDGDSIRILAAESTYKKIHLLRGTYQARAVLLNSIYLPAVMSVLVVLKDDSAQYEGKRWHRVFSARTDHLGIDLATADPLDGAQRVLAAPFGRIELDSQAL